MERLSMEMNCKKCGRYIGEPTGKKGRPPKYCKDCAYTNHLQNMADLAVSRRAYKKEIGTIDMGSKMSRKENGEPDFDKEANIIKRELRKLRLQK